MTLALVETRVAETKPNVLHVTLENVSDTPITLAFVFDSSKGYPSKILSVPKKLAGYRMFMVTRRSIVNPEERVKFRLELPMPVSEYPPKARFQLGILEHFVRIPLDPAEALALSAKQ
jgi:hypothetical protein